MNIKLLFAKRLAWLFLFLLGISFIDCEKKLSLEEIDVKFLSELRFRLRKSPTKLEQCLSYLQRLNEWHSSLPREESLEASTTTKAGTTEVADKGVEGRTGAAVQSSGEGRWPIGTNLMAEVSGLLRNKKWAFGNNNLADYLETCVAIIKVQQCEQFGRQESSEPLNERNVTATIRSSPTAISAGLDDGQKEDEKLDPIRKANEKLGAENDELQGRIANLEDERRKLEAKFANELKRLEDFYRDELDSCSSEAQKAIKERKQMLDECRRTCNEERWKLESQLSLLETKIDKIRPILRSAEEERDDCFNKLRESEELRDRLLNQIEISNMAPKDQREQENNSQQQHEHWEQQIRQQQRSEVSKDDEEMYDVPQEAEAMDEDEHEHENELHLGEKRFSWPFQVPIEGSVRGNNWKPVPVVHVITGTGASERHLTPLDPFWFHGN